MATLLSVHSRFVQDRANLAIAERRKEPKEGIQTR
jgi:hypothetical protein